MNLTKAIYNNIPAQFKYKLLRAYFLARNPRFITTPYQAKLNNNKPVLIISMPRSGSSWVGKVLSNAADSLYLREPMSQAHRINFPKVQSEYSPNALEYASEYKRYAYHAFKGSPAFLHSSIFEPSRWHQKDNKVRVIKEINPLLLQYFVDEFQPKIIYLARNPVAVANSYFTQHWLSNRFTRAFTEQENKALQKKYLLDIKNEFWHDFGLFQSVVDSLSKDILENYQDKIIVKYEDICQNPCEEFKRLYNFSGLAFTEAQQAYIAKTSNAKTNYQVGNYDTERNSLDMANKWKELVSQENIQAVKSGYLSLSNTIYKADDF